MRLVVLDEQGLWFVTRRIAMDGISLGDAADGRLTGISRPESSSRRFVPDLGTGVIIGGAPLDDTP